MEVTIDNITLNYIKEGEGEPVILLHGNGEDHRIFDKLIEKLKNDFTVYALDSRNHGLSSKTDRFNYEVMADDLAAFLKALQLEKPSVVGFSDGAIICLLSAIKQNQIFDKMILSGINLRPSDFKKDCYIYLQEEYNKTKDPLLKLMLEEPDINLKDLLNIHVPTLVVAADDDLFEEKVFHSIVETMPDAQLKIMTGHKHDTYITHQDILYPIVKQFINNTNQKLN